MSTLILKRNIEKYTVLQNSLFISCKIRTIRKFFYSVLSYQFCEYLVAIKHDNVLHNTYVFVDAIDNFTKSNVTSLQLFYFLLNAYITTYLKQKKLTVFPDTSNNRTGIIIVQGGV